MSPSGSSLLHEAASYGSQVITELVARHFPWLITKQNFEGDTPLHVAARDGNLETTETLVSCAKDFADVGSLLRVKNKEGNTALHEAVMKSDHQNVQFLLKEAPEVAYLANSEDKSPLYLVIDTVQDVKYIRTISEAIEADVDSLHKLEGKPPMKAAIKLKTFDILEEMVNRKPEFMEYKDLKERSPLHWAASTGSVDGVRYLLSKFNHTALAKDKDGLYPIHLACKNGHVDVIRELLKTWPEPTELLSNKGQNILHIAALNGKEKVVEFLISTRPERNVDKLVNKKDHDGNTPLHLATIHGRSYIVWSLLRGRKKDYFKLKNKQSLTAYDIAEKHIVGDEEATYYSVKVQDQQLVENQSSEQHVERKSSTEHKRPDFRMMTTFSLLQRCTGSRFNIL